VHVLTAKGELKTFQTSGSPNSLVWSPDGRWLTYNQGYRGEQRLAQVLVDTETWQERVVGYTVYCGCLTLYRATWSPDSRYFMYDSAEEGGNRVVGTLTRESFAAPPYSGWTKDGKGLFAFKWRDDTPPTYDVVYFDVRSRETKVLGAQLLNQLPWPIPWPLPQPQLGSPISPDETRLAYTPRAAPGTTTVTSLDGKELLTGIEGEFDSWSPDGRFFLTRSLSSECAGGHMVYRAEDGRAMTCLPWGFAVFSPDSSTVAYSLLNPLDANNVSSFAPFKVGLYAFEIESGVTYELLSDIRAWR